MTETRIKREHREQVLDQVAHVSDANKTMYPYEHRVEITLTSTTSSTVTPPNVDEASGEYVVKLVSVGTGKVTVTGIGNLGAAGSELRFWPEAGEWKSKVTTAGLFEVFDDFTEQTLTEANGPWIENSGSDAQALDPAINAAACGTVRLVTGNADGTTAADASQIVCHLPMTAAAGGLFGEVRLKCVTNVATMSLFAGFTDVTTLEEPFTNSADVITSTASDAFGFLYDTDATTDTWWTVAVDTDVDDTGNAAITALPVADTYQVLRVESDIAGDVLKFYVDGVHVKTLSGTGGITPGTSLYFTVVACATTTTSKTVDIDYINIGHCR